MNLAELSVRLDRLMLVGKLLPAEPARLRAFAEAIERPSLPTVLDDLLNRIEALTALRGPVVPATVQARMLSASSAGVLARFDADAPMTSQQVQRKRVDWYLMVALNFARPNGADAGVLLSVIQASYPDATEQEVRCELDHLHNRGLIDIDKRPDGRRHCELSSLGIILVENTSECEQVLIWRAP